ncbi:unnamed protein product [Rhizoctonia solani]|uniref:Adenylate cyclase G-alpha binding domain-containing protein n=1 Tax=Rhizoctonia solani TaxID=456999 RepID=A0A8H3HFB6_9AGAM|nr:unnamed protein product [Rhizoctonia solani]
MAQTHRQGFGAQINHNWGQDHSELVGDSSVIAPWLDDTSDPNASLEPPSPPATKRSFLGSMSSLHGSSRQMQHQPSIGSISLFKGSRPSDPVGPTLSDSTLAPPSSIGYGEPSPSSASGKKSKGILSRLKRKASRVNVRPGSSGADDETFSWSQSTLNLPGPPATLPPSPTTATSGQKKARKTSRARAQPQPVAEFTLDTNLDEMDGIIARPTPNQSQYNRPPWHDDGSDGSHIGGSAIIGRTGMPNVQSPTAAYFTDPFSNAVFPATPSTGGVPKPLPEPPLQVNGHRPGSPTAGVGLTSTRNIPSPPLPRSDWAAPESWAVDGAGPREEDYSSDSDDDLPAPTGDAISSLPGRSDSVGAGSVNRYAYGRPPGSAGGVGMPSSVGSTGIVNGAVARSDRRLNSAGIQYPNLSHGWDLSRRNVPYASYCGEDDPCARQEIRYSTRVVRIIFMGTQSGYGQF